MFYGVILLKLILIFPTLTLFGLTFILTGCPGPKGEEPASGVEGEKMYVRGNPAELVAGAAFDTTSPITEANASLWNQFALFKLVEFPEREAVQRNRDILKENATPDRTVRKTTVTLDVNVERESDGDWYLSLGNQSRKIKLKRLDDGHLQPYAIRLADGDLLPVVVLHWSSRWSA